MLRFARAFSWLAAIITVAGALNAVEIPLNGGSASGSSGAVTPISATGGVGYVDMEKVFNEHPLCKRSHEAFLTEADKRKLELKNLELEINQMQGVIVSSTTRLDALRTDLALLQKGIIPGETNAVQQSSATPAAPSAPPPSPESLRRLPGMLIPGTTTPVESAPATGTPSSSSEAPLTSTASAPAPATPPAAADFRVLITSVTADIKRFETDIEGMKTVLQQRKGALALKLKTNKDELCQLEASQTNEVLQDIYVIIEKIAKEDNIKVILDRKDVLYGQAYQDITNKVLERLQGR